MESSSGTVNHIHSNQMLRPLAKAELHPLLRKMQKRKGSISMHVNFILSQCMSRVISLHMCGFLLFFNLELRFTKNQHLSQLPRRM